MEAGCAVAAGSSRSSAASTARRSSSKKEESFIAAGNRRAAGCRGESRFGLPLGIERLSGQLAIGFFQKNFHSSLRLFQLLLALAREGDALFEQFHRVVQRELGALQAADDLLKPGQRALKIGLLRWLGFLGSR